MKNTLYLGYRYPSQIISHAVWLYHRFTLSFRDIEELLAARVIMVTYETIRKWCEKFGSAYCNHIKKTRGRLGDTWYLDEIFIRINDVQHYLWRAVDQDGDEIDILIQKRKDKSAAMRFFKKLLKGQQATHIKLVTDRLRSYAAAKRDLMPRVSGWGSGVHTSLSPPQAPISKNGLRILGAKVKKDDSEELRKIENTEIKNRVKNLAIDCFVNLGVRDYGRIDIKSNKSGHCFFIEANLVPGMTSGSSYFPVSCEIEALFHWTVGTNYSSF